MVFSLFLLKNRDTRKNRLIDAILTSAHNLCFRAKMR